MVVTMRAAPARPAFQDNRRMIYLLGQWRLVYAQMSIRHMIGIMRYSLVHDREGGVREGVR
jgi:hypothetical protein